MAETRGEIRKHRHPGRGQGRASARPKGRQVDPAALDAVRALLGDRPRRRDLLIEHLHLIQDRFGHLSAAHLAALAEEMRLAQTEVYEVATFYAHLDVVKEGGTPPPALTVRVCDSLTCELMGAAELMAGLRAGLDPQRVRVMRAPCMGHCDGAPVAEVGHHYVDQATPAKVASAIKAGETHADIPGGTDFEHYVEGGGYRLLRRYLGLDAASYQADQAVLDLLGALNTSGLRGLGGAGFPAGRKWELVRKRQKPRYLAVNADEGEPGTFKDRYCLVRDPHRFLEGALIAAWSIEAEAVYIYLRDEYPGIREVLLREIPKLEAAGLAPPGFLELRRGAGAYICGEESAMLESIEGKRGLPRHRPPYAAEVGLFGRPTLINNVETLYWVRDIVEKACAATRSPAGSRSPASSSRPPASRPMS
jgi:NADH:ubiquinone oxidoreductase subunit E